MSNHDDIDQFSDGDLDEVLEALAETVAVAPPGDVRARLLGVAESRRRSLTAGVSAPLLYARRVAAMSDLLDTLGTDDWGAPAVPYPWTVQQLLGHLTVIEEYTARQFGLMGEAPMALASSSTVNHLSMGLDQIQSLSTATPSEVVRRWRAAASLVVDHVTSTSYQPQAPVPMHAWPFEAETALVARSFELWTHADDIRRATARPLDVPAAEELRTMSSTSVLGLPVLLAVIDGPPLQPTRVVLTGAGGGTFDLGPSASTITGGRSLLVVDVVDYCRVVARRADPRELPLQRDGDADLLDALLRAACVIAV